MLALRDLISAYPWMMACWVFVVGSAIGSFLNVVVYRLPRGRSLSNPPSHCPRCGHPIRWYHNLPVAGWLVLGGKCYDCRAAISPRYPLVELAAGLMFVALAWFDVYRPIATHTDGDATVDESRLLVDLAEFAGHAWIGATLLAAVLIRCDGQRVPLRLVLPAMAIAVLLLLVAPPQQWLGLLVVAVVLLVIPLRRSPTPH